MTAFFIFIPIFYFCSIYKIYIKQTLNIEYIMFDINYSFTTSFSSETETIF
jgi:hypothetical protein